MGDVEFQPCMAIYGVTHAELYGWFEYGTIIRYVGPVTSCEKMEAMALGKCGKALMLPSPFGQRMFVFEPRPVDWIADMPK